MLILSCERLRARNSTSAKNSAISVDDSIAVAEVVKSSFTSGSPDNTVIAISLKPNEDSGYHYRSKRVNESLSKS